MEKLKPCPFCGEDGVKEMVTSVDFIHRFYCKYCDTAFKFSDGKVVKIVGIERTIFIEFYNCCEKMLSLEQKRKSRSGGQSMSDLGK